jgi:hypothetical protein
MEAQSREQARLEWEAAAPAREKLAQMKIDSERLDAMRARIGPQDLEFQGVPVFKRKYLPADFVVIVSMNRLLDVLQTKLSISSQSTRFVELSTR